MRARSRGWYRTAASGDVNQPRSTSRCRERAALLVAILSLTNTGLAYRLHPAAMLAIDPLLTLQPVALSGHVIGGAPVRRRMMRQQRAAGIAGHSLI